VKCEKERCRSPVACGSFGFCRASMVLSYDNWLRCCRQVINETEDPHGRVYAEAGLRLHDLYQGQLLSEAVKCQARYVLCNVDDWRGEEARQCKLWLRSFQLSGLQ
jgi:hypothetical protein